MDLRILSIARMVSLSEQWLKEPRKALLERYPETSALLPKLQDAHESLFVLTAPPEPPKELKEIFEKQKVTDIRHDDLVTSSYSILTGLARRERESSVREVYLKLRDQLFPDGVSIVKLPYEEEGGAAILLERRLTDEHRSQLKAIVFPGGVTLLDDINDLIKQGKQLLSLNEQKRAILEAPSTQPRPADELKSKLLWIRVVRALESNLSLAGASEEEVKDFFREAEEASASAERKLPEPLPEKKE